MNQIIKPKLPLFLLYSAKLHCYTQEIKYHFSPFRSKVTNGGSESWSGSPIQLLPLQGQFGQIKYDARDTGDTVIIFF